MLCNAILEDGGIAGGGLVRSGIMSGFPLVVAPMGDRLCRGLERRDVIHVY